MARRRVAAKRDILPEPKYNSEVLAKFINVLMLNGQKSVAEKIVRTAIESTFVKLEKRYEVDKESSVYPVVQLFNHILQKIKPSVEVRSRRVGGATYQVPVEVLPRRGMALAMRWLVQAARGRKEQGMQERLAAEMLDIFDGRGAAVKKCEDTHRMAKANQAFAHFRWN